MQHYNSKWGWGVPGGCRGVTSRAAGWSLSAHIPFVSFPSHLYDSCNPSRLFSLLLPLFVFLLHFHLTSLYFFTASILPSLILQFVASFFRLCFPFSGFFWCYSNCRTLNFYLFIPSNLVCLDPSIYCFFPCLYLFVPYLPFPSPFHRARVNKLR